MKSHIRFFLLLIPAWVFLMAMVLLPLLIFWRGVPDELGLLLRGPLLSHAGFVLLTLIVGLVVSGLCLYLAWRSFFIMPLQLAEQLHLVLDTNPEYRLRGAVPSPLRPLVDAINSLADRRAALQRDIEMQIRLANVSLEEERNRLAALMSELSQSVIVCNLDGRILLYNHRAIRQFHAFDRKNETLASPIGLGRSIFSVFDRNLIAHALEKLQHKLDIQASHSSELYLVTTNFVTATPSGQLIRVQMAPVLVTPVVSGDIDAMSSRHIGGYVLMLDDVTRIVESDTQRDRILQSLTEGSRSALANIRAAVESLIEYPDIESAQREHFLRIIGDEARDMGSRLDRVIEDHSDALKARWPLEEMRAADFVAAAQRRIKSRLGLDARIDVLDGDLWIKVDSFSLTQVIAYLASRLRESFSVQTLSFRLILEGRLARLDMIWPGTPLSAETLHAWEHAPMNQFCESTPLSLHDIVERHGGAFWFQMDQTTSQAGFHLLLPMVERQEGFGAVPRSGSRPEFYDFDLFRRSGENRNLDDCRLTDLTYTVFDTETTGLDPSGGDEIIQFGAVRIVNGRLLRHESFDRLVDPHRALRPESMAVHGITGEMLAGQPDIARVLPAFAGFVEDTVLVAHNAAFDMRFLQLKETSTGICFTQPVLDTLLLSAVLQPNQESHRIEDIAARFGISVIGRHTALGDAIVTGEIFLRMIPLLDSMGIHTLGEARAASQRTYYARIRY